MIRKLDFVVLGLPRSGTSAMARHLSSLPGIHCGQEVFPTFLDHATLPIPDSFLSHPDPHWSDRSVETVRARRDRIRVYGNKTPTYFYRLPSLLDELDNAPAVVCLRDLQAVAASYARRAGDAQDSWPAGRVGLFALGDALLMLHALAAVPARARVLLVPQQGLLTDPAGVMGRVVAHVAPDLAPGLTPAMGDALAGLRHTARPAPLARPADPSPGPDPSPDPDPDAAAWSVLARAGVPDFFATGQIRDLAACRDEIAALLAATPPNPVAFLRRQIADHPNPAAADFADRWRRHGGRLMRSLAPAA